MMSFRQCIPLLAVLLTAWLAPSASATFGIKPGTLSVTTSTLQAGAHPDLTTSFMLNRSLDPELGYEVADDNPKDVQVDLPAGLVGGSTATPQCRGRYLANPPYCPPAAQVGVVTLRFTYGGFDMVNTLPVFNLVPSNGETAELGFFMGASQRMAVRLRPTDGGLRTVLRNISEDMQLVGTTLTLWGVPAAAEHDAWRGSRFACYGDPSNPANCFGGGYSANVAARPFLTNPTSCDGGPLAAHMRVASWQQPGETLEYTAPMGEIEGCDKLQFHPSVSVEPDTTQVDAPLGLTVRVDVPQNDDPNGLATANLRKAVVTLPKGISLNPAVADGLAACSDAQLGVGSAEAPSCPAASKIGTAKLVTPAITDPLDGDIYLRPQKGDDPYRIALVLHGSGVMLKLPGLVRADPVSGQLETTFDDAPQQPFSSLELTFKGGERAPLATPAACGTGTATSVMTPASAPFSGPPATPSDDVAFSWDGAGAPCPATLPFAPAFAAGVSNPVAGTSSPFVFRLTRPDRQQALGAIADVDLPPGLLANVAGVPLCGEAAAAAGTCSAESRVGDVTVASGAGSHPLTLPGQVYLTGPYKGSAFGLAIVVRAVAGPFDLGTVVVRAAVTVNRDTSLRVTSDPLPTIIQGLPLRLRDIVLDFNRPGFMINPTSCAPARVSATAVSVDGARAPVSSRFALAGCAALGYAPKIALALGGREKSGTTALTAHVAPRPGDANSKRISVQLPDGVGLNVKRGEGLCSVAQLDARSCPASSVVGHASVDSILPEPLTGPVYLVQGKDARSPLPRLWVPVTGDGVTIDLMASTTLRGSQIVTTFEPIPDVPFTSFDLQIDGGTRGLLAARRKICDATLTSAIHMDGHNGKRADRTVVVPAGCALRVLSKRLTRTALTLEVTGLGRGTLRVAGAGLRTAKRTIGSATVATITARRSRATTPAGVKVTFDPAGPAKAKTISVATPKR